MKLVKIEGWRDFMWEMLEQLEERDRELLTAVRARGNCLRRLNGFIVACTMAMPHLDSQQTGRTMTLESFAEAYIKGFRLTVRFLLSKGATPDEAEETAQTAWARGWEARSQLQLENRVLAWVNTIAYHRLCEGYRYTVENVELTDIADPKSGSEATRFDAAILLNRCSALDRPLMEQRYIEGMGMKEIAARMGLSEIAVRVRIHRCQHRLRSSIRREEETRPSPDLFLGDRSGAGRGASS